MGTPHLRTSLHRSSNLLLRKLVAQCEQPRWRRAEHIKREKKSELAAVLAATSIRKTEGFAQRVQCCAQRHILRQANNSTRRNISTCSWIWMS